MHKPMEDHWITALRVVRYLKGCPDQGIMLSSDADLSLTAYSDSDWSACPLTRRSLCAYVVLLGDSLASWKTRKQRTVSRSSAEAEYRSMADATCELKWLKHLLFHFGFPHTKPMRLFCDSQSALHIARTRCSMSVRNMSRIIATMFVMRFKRDLSLPSTLLQRISLRTCSPKLCLHRHFITCCPSWELWICHCQLEGGRGGGG